MTLSASSTDTGFVRANNEDRVYVDDARGFYLVVDGMGGQEAGEQAAAIAVERIRARLERQTGTVEQRLREAITLANNSIYEAAQNQPEWKGMACVLTVAVVEDGQVTIGHVGDSRLYTIKRKAIEKITHDHSPVGEREDRGEITEAEAMNHPRRNEVFRDVGSQEHTPDDPDFIEILRIAFAPDTALLLCSDGLSDAISSQRILAIVEENAGDRAAIVRALIEAATQVGKDNVSAVFVEGEKFAASFEKPKPKPKPKPKQPQRPIVTDAPPVRTVIHHAHVAWYKSGPAWLLCGLLIGALACFAALKFLIPEQSLDGPATLFVKAPDTIAATLEKARPGDTVYVTPGTYTEAIHLKDSVDLVSQRAHDAIVEGPVTADNIRHSRFEGFQVHGLTIHDSDVNIARIEVSGSSDAGVEFSGTSRGSIVASWIHDNTGPGILIKDSAAPYVENNIVISNGMVSKRPGLLMQSSLHPRVTANIFLGNGAEAIWMPEPAQSLIDRNYFNISGKPDNKPKFRIIAPPGGSRESR